MITEATIEQTIDYFENDQEAYVDALARIMDTQPALLAFLGQESIDILLEEEKDILWYMVLIIYTSIKNSDKDIIDISDDNLGVNEEHNWTLFQDQPRGTFREKITVFFEDYPQEDLLAFVEDTLEIEEDSPITAVGRDVVFITAKSIIDTLLPLNK